MTETKKNPIGRFIENTLVPISTAFAQNRYVRCIGTGSQNLMAIIMIGAVFNLLNSIQIDPYQSFIQATGIAAFLNAVYNACMNFMGVFMVFSVGYAGAKIFGHDEMAFNNGLMSLMSYLIMVPVATNEVGSTVVVLDYLGSHGRSEEHTSELQSRGLIPYAVFCLKKQTKLNTFSPNIPQDP